ncbi:MAG TPA: ATP-binding protein [Polyangiaceae bacterium]|nr:ATP-binding protein [Polyangiaceae bacterium]
MRAGRCGPRRRGWSARLKTRLLLWFLAAIVLAFGVSSLTLGLTRPDSEGTATQVVARRVQLRLAKEWDDTAACERYVRELRDATGLDFKLVRDPQVLPRRSRRHRGSPGMTFDEGVAYVPIVRGGEVVGALALRSSAGAPGPLRLVLGLLAGGLVLSAVARKVAKRISRPLEQVAQAAERFGNGELSARTGLDPDARSSEHIADEVREVAYTFDEMAARIERVVRDQRELLGAISHELRSPLGRARVGLELVAEDVSPDARKTLEGIDRELSEVDLILGDLLAAARAGLSDVRLEQVALLPWLRGRLAALSRPDLPPLELDAGALDASGAEAGELTVACDQALLGRALSNLVNNAALHGHDAGAPITVAVERDAAEVRLLVRDRGPGIATDLLPRVFEPFVKGDKARTPGKAGGSGLGLALVLRIAEAHGGRAFAENHVDGQGAVDGAIVGLALPLRA